jgi:hypothetical protein
MSISGPHEAVKHAVNPESGKPPSCAAELGQ